MNRFGRRAPIAAITLGLAGLSAPAAAQVVPPYFTDYEAEADCGTSCTGGCNLLTAGWSNATGDNTNWLAHRGSTPSTATGPDADHSLGSAAGAYLYVESSGCSNATANLASPVFDFTGVAAPQASFWYHMLGATMGSLHVDVSTDGGLTFPDLDVASVTGENGNTWHLLGVNLTPYANEPAVVVRVRGLTGSSFTSDIAIDDFAVCDSNSPPDVGIVAMSPPELACDLDGTTTVEVQIKNHALCASSPASFDVQYAVDGGAPVTETFAGGPIAAGATATYTFTATANLSGAGPFDLVARTLATGDIDASNDTFEQTVSEVGGAVAAYPSLEDFEQGSDRWFSAAVGTSANSWAFGTPNKSVIQGAASGANAWTTGGLTGFYGDLELSYIQTRCGYDMSALAAPAVSMSVWWQAEFSWDGAQLQTSTDGGASWQTVGDVGSGHNWYTDNTIVGLADSQSGWSGRTSTSNGSGTWVLAAHEIASLAGQPNVLMRIRFGTDGSVTDEGVAFDDIEVFDNVPGVAIGSVGPAQTPDGTAPGSSDVLVHALRVRATGAADQSLTTVAITQRGDLPDADVSAVRLWLDDGDGAFDAALDVLVGTQTFTAGRATFDTTGLLTLPLFERHLLFVSYDIAAGAPAFATFGSRIAAVGDVVVQSGDPAAFDGAVVEGPLFSVFGFGTVPYFEDFGAQEVGNLARESAAGLAYPQAAAAGDVPALSGPSAADAAVELSSSVVVGGTDVAAHSAPNMMSLAFPGGAATGAFDLHFDMSGMTVAADDVWVGFYWNNADQEDHLEDNVFVSSDGGATWATSLYRFDFSAPVAPAWEPVLLDLSAALAAAGGEYSGDVILRFQASGAGALGDDGLLVDDVFVGKAMQVDLQRPIATLIADGGTDAVGPALVGAQTLTYTLTNPGDLPLDVDPATFAAANAVNAANITFTPPAENPLPAGASTTFEVDFTVAAASAFSFDFSFTADDPRLGDEQFDVSVDGSGTDREIDVQRPAGSSLANDATDNLGTVASGEALTLTYTIANLGTAELGLPGASVVDIQNASANVDASVVAQPAATLAPAASEAFDVELTVSDTEDFSFDLVIANDDADEAPYTITVTGNGAIPEIDVQRPAGTPIADGATDEQGEQAPGAAQTLSYTLANLGGVDLELTGTPVVAIVNATNVEAAVAAQPADSLAPAATATFDVSYTPVDRGAFSFDLVVASNDANESPYEITIHGTASDEGMGGMGGMGGTGAGGDGGAAVTPAELEAGGDGCSCSVPGSAGEGPWGATLTLGLLGFAVGRRRRAT
jgi:MYXO-CTERM domain-containing protein